MKRWGWPGHGAAIQVCVAVTAAVGVVMLSTYINKQARCVPSSRLLAPIEREGERERERERSCGSLSTQNAAAMRAAHTQLPLSLTHPSLSSHSHSHLSPPPHAAFPSPQRSQWRRRHSGRRAWASLPAPASCSARACCTCSSHPLVLRVVLRGALALPPLNWLRCRAAAEVPCSTCSRCQYHADGGRSPRTQERADMCAAGGVRGGAVRGSPSSDGGRLVAE
jgi:hypothetical protein